MKEAELSFRGGGTAGIAALGEGAAAGIVVRVSHRRHATVWIPRAGGYIRSTLPQLRLPR